MHPKQQLLTILPLTYDLLLTSQEWPIFLPLASLLILPITTHTHRYLSPCLNPTPLSLDNLKPLTITKSLPFDTLCNLTPDKVFLPDGCPLVRPLIQAGRAEGVQDRSVKGYPHRTIPYLSVPIHKRRRAPFRNSCHCQRASSRLMSHRTTQQTHLMDSLQ